jgi:hypothetical protein
MNAKNTIEAVVKYQNGRHFAVNANGQWAITTEDNLKFSLQDSLTIVIAVPNPEDQFCQVEYVVSETEVFNRQFEEWEGDSKDNE